MCSRTPAQDISPDSGRHLAATTAALSTGLNSVKDLAQATGYTESTIRRHLQQLQEHRVARLSSRPTPGSWRRTATRLDTVARRIGATGVRERRHRAYAIERTAYGWWLAELERMHTPGPRRRAVRGQGRLILAGAPNHAKIATATPATAAAAPTTEQPAGGSHGTRTPLWERVHHPFLTERPDRQRSHCEVNVPQSVLNGNIVSLVETDISSRRCI